jgi:hypothetical protein
MTAETEILRPNDAQASAAPTPPSQAWLNAQIAAQQQVVASSLGALTATDVYQQYQRDLAVLLYLQQQAQAFRQTES